jgi:hypothetical protein
MGDNFYCGPLVSVELGSITAEMNHDLLIILVCSIHAFLQTNSLYFLRRDFV